MYASPVVYLASMILEAIQPLYRLNPIAGVIEGFRWALLSMEIPKVMIFVSVGVVVVRLVSGMFYFRRIEHADIV